MRNNEKINGLKNITSLSMFEELLEGKQPVLLLFKSDFCFSCNQVEAKLFSWMHLYKDIEFVALHRGEVEGLEKAFGLRSTPTIVSVSRKKQIAVNRNCDQLTEHQWKILLEELHETDSSLFL